MTSLYISPPQVAHIVLLLYHQPGNGNGIGQRSYRRRPSTGTLLPYRSGRRPAVPAILSLSPASSLERISDSTSFPSGAKTPNRASRQRLTQGRRLASAEQVGIVSAGAHNLTTGEVCQ